MPALDFIYTDFEPVYRELTVAGGSLAWWEEGVGEPAILWVHGLPLDSRSWEAQRRHFSPLCRNVFVDLRGYGWSSKVPGGVKDITDLYCADIAALIAAAHLEKAMLIGFASAGHVALRLDAQRGDLLSRLVVNNGSPRFRQGNGWPWGFTDATAERFLAPLKAGRIWEVTDMILAPENVFQDLTAEEGARLAAWFRPMSLNAGAETLLGFFDGISRDDDRALLEEIRLPTLLISSVLGQEVPHQVASYMRGRISDSYLAELPPRTTSRLQPAHTSSTHSSRVSEVDRPPTGYAVKRLHAHPKGREQQVEAKSWQGHHAPSSPLNRAFTYLTQLPQNNELPGY